MFDGDVGAQDEFEENVISSIQKALSDLWFSYKFPFRYKTKTIKTAAGKQRYAVPDGQIVRKTVNGKSVYGISYQDSFLPQTANIAGTDTGTPSTFFIKDDYIYLCPIPDDVYNIDIESLSIFPAMSEDGEPKGTLTEENDYIDVPERYETLFLHALMPLAMYLYLIASDSDENWSGYKLQYERALKNLIEFSKVLETDRTIGWR